MFRSAYFWWAFLLGGEAFAQQDCRSCHKPRADEHAASVHAQKDITCTSCHGTDTFDMTRTLKPHRYDATFDTGRSTLTLCAKCHEPEVDQFKRSAHLDFESGEGRRRAKNCVVCHAPHRTEVAAIAILQARCVGCHGGRVDGIVTTLTESKALTDVVLAKTKGYRPPPGINAKPEFEGAEEVRLLMASLRRDQHAAKASEIAARKEAIKSKQKSVIAGLAEHERAMARRPLWLLAFLGVVSVFVVSAVRLARQRFV